MASLTAAVELFKSKIGHEPQNVTQLFNFCKMENLPFKYSAINKWWKNGKTDIPKQSDDHHHTTKSSATNKKTKSSKIYKLLKNKNNFLKLLNSEIESFKTILSKYNCDHKTIKQSIKTINYF